MRPAKVPVATAASGAGWEAALVAAWGRAGDLAVVRRCVAVPDLLACAEAGLVRAVVLSASLRRLDREVVARLDRADAAVVGVAESPDAAIRLRNLGVPVVLDAGSDPDEVAAAVLTAVRRSDVVAVRPVGPLGPPDPPSSAPPSGPPDDPDEGQPAAEAGGEAPAAMSRRSGQRGCVVAVWGPAGAPGRTTVSVLLADELARLGLRVLLADADTYGASVAAMLGVTDEQPGLAAAVRAASSGTLDAAGLAGAARSVGRFAVLTGLSRPERWAEVRPASFAAVLGLARELADVTVVDTGFSVEQDEDLTYDTSAPQRNGATLTALAECDLVVAVAAAEPLGLQRMVRSYAAVRTLAGGDVVLVANRVRRSAVGGDPRVEVTDALTRFIGVRPLTLLPDDRAAADAAVLSGRTLGEAAPRSPVRSAAAPLVRAVAGLVASGSGAETRPTGRPRWGRRRAG